MTSREIFSTHSEDSILPISKIPQKLWQVHILRTIMKNVKLSKCFMKRNLNCFEYLFIRANSFLPIDIALEQRKSNSTLSKPEKKWLRNPNDGFTLDKQAATSSKNIYRLYDWMQSSRYSIGLKWNGHPLKNTSRKEISDFKDLRIKISLTQAVLGQV